MPEPMVYILTNHYNSVLYTGVTSDLATRLEAHKSRRIPGFSNFYRATRLVFVERHESMHAAITREKQLKNWKRVWKTELIESLNPEWRDLSGDWL